MFKVSHLGVEPPDLPGRRLHPRHNPGHHLFHTLQYRYRNSCIHTLLFVEKSILFSCLYNVRILHFFPSYSVPPQCSVEMSSLLFSNKPFSFLRRAQPPLSPVFSGLPCPPAALDPSLSCVPPTLASDFATAGHILSHRNVRIM